MPRTASPRTKNPPTKNLCLGNSVKFLRRPRNSTPKIRNLTGSSTLKFQFLSSCRGRTCVCHFVPRKRGHGWSCHSRSGPELQVINELTTTHASTSALTTTTPATTPYAMRSQFCACRAWRENAQTNREIEPVEVFHGQRRFCDLALSPFEFAPRTGSRNRLGSFRRLPACTQSSAAPPGSCGTCARPGRVCFLSRTRPRQSCIAARSCMSRASKTSNIAALVLMSWMHPGSPFICAIHK